MIVEVLQLLVDHILLTHSPKVTNILILITRSTRTLPTSKMYFPNKVASLIWLLHFPTSKLRHPNSNDNKYFGKAESPGMGIKTHPVVQVELEEWPVCFFLLSFYYLILIKYKI